MTINETFFHFGTDLQWPLECHPDTGEDLLKHKEMDESKDKSYVLPGNKTYVDESGKRHDYSFCDKYDNEYEHNDRMNENRPYESVRWLKI
jgi:hypothetical protein